MAGISNTNKSINAVAVDLFCGVGGKTHGFINAGLSVAAGYDIDATCRYAYEKNNSPAKFICKAVEAVTASELDSWYPQDAIKILIGCAPCQPFSTYSYRYGTITEKSTNDGRWSLLSNFKTLIRELRPTIVSAENVPQLSRLKHEVYVDFIRELKNLGYYVTERIVKCADYGVPQTRERLVVLASLLAPIDIVPPTHRPASYLTVRKTIGHLPAITAGAHDDYGDDALHISSRLSPLNLKRIKATPEGGGWQDWPMKLRLECHKKASGLTYPSVYGRMEWDGLGPTITTQCFGLGNGRFGHPSQNRAISLREAALLQTFPDDYSFTAPSQKPVFKNIGRHIGNAVPVKLAEVIARSILLHLHVDAAQRPDIHKLQRIA